MRQANLKKILEIVKASEPIKRNGGIIDSSIVDDGKKRTEVKYLPDLVLATQEGHLTEAQATRLLESNDFYGRIILPKGIEIKSPGYGGVSQLQLANGDELPNAVAEDIVSKVSKHGLEFQLGVVQKDGEVALIYETPKGSHLDQTLFRGSFTNDHIDSAWKRVAEIKPQKTYAPHGRL